MKPKIVFCFLITFIMCALFAETTPLLTANQQMIDVWDSDSEEEV